jgi:diguanylate cyclase
MIAAQDEIQQRLAKIVNQTIENVSAASKDAQNFDASISGHSQQLASSADAESTQMLISQMLADTRQMVRNSNDLSSRMNETNAEVVALKKELESVKLAAQKDSLTGLLNRGALDSIIGEVAESPVGDPNPTCVMMMDIDHFKRINDNFGHLVGDRVIRYLAALLKQVIGENQIIARYGGEEFAVVMKNTPMEDVVKLAEKVRVALGKSKLQRKDSGETIGKVTISIGVSTHRWDDSAESLIERADSALYHAKNTGRDQVVTENDLN